MLKNMTELQQILSGEDVISGRGFVVEHNDNMVVFTRIQVIYSTAGTSRTRVWDVVDYNESENGSHVATYYSAKEAKSRISEE